MSFDKKQQRIETLNAMFSDEGVKYKAYIKTELLRFLFRVISLINTTVAGILALIGITI